MLSPDWVTRGYKEELEKKIGNGFVTKEGWTLTDTDTCYCYIIPNPIKGGETLYKVEIWNRPNVNEELLDILKKPVYKS